MNQFPELSLGTMFDAPRMWQGVHISEHTGTLRELLQVVPHFERKAFIIGDLVNPNADLIVRIPMNQEETPVPVAMVSKTYVLADHHAAIGRLAQALGHEVREPDKLRGRLLLTEYGERIHLCVRVPDWAFTLTNSETFDLDVHLLNSVDRSLSLQVRLGWYRGICRNGAFFGVEAAGFRQAHTPPLDRIDIGEMLAEQLEEFRHEKERLQSWLEMPVQLDALVPWIDGAVAKRWGIIAAARLYSILQTGYTGTVILTGGKHPPHAYRVQLAERVPGVPERATTLFDVSQALSWMAMRTASVQDQLVRMAEVYPLMAKVIDDYR